MSEKQLKEREREELITRFFAYGEGLDDYKDRVAPTGRGCGTESSRACRKTLQPNGNFAYRAAILTSGPGAATRLCRT